MVEAISQLRDRTGAEASKAFGESDEILALAEASAGIGVWDLDLPTGLLRGTAQFFRIMGLQPTAELVPIETTRRLRHPDDSERVLRGFNDAVASGADYYETEYRIIRPDGDLRWILGRGRVIRDACGIPARYSGVDVDITSRKLAEAALRDSEQRFRRVFEQSPLGKAMAGLDFRFRAVNPALCAMLGYTEDELVGRSFLDIVHPDDRDDCAAMGQALLDGTTPQVQIEERFLRKCGDALWVSVNVGPIRDADGHIVYTLGIIENIDERKRVAQALLDSENRLRLLNERLEQQAEERATQLASSRAQLQAFFVNSPDWLTLQRATPDGRIAFADINPTSETAYGLPREQVIGRTAEDILGVEAARIPLHHFRECLRTGQPQRYVARRTLAGRTTTIDVMCVLVPEVAAGGDRFIITTARDLTEREQLEAQLRQAQKMEAIGQLTGGVAHDFNNLLAVIGGNAELAKRRPTGNNDRQMDNILRATERGVALTRQLLSFSRRHVATPQVIDLHVEMPRMAEMLRASLRGDIQMRIDVAEHLWPIEADVAELEMALLNIAVNARDAMPQGGTFTVDVRNADAGRRHAGQRSCRDCVARQRRRHSARRDRQGVRSVLHHQAARRGNRPRPQPGLRLRAAVGWCGQPGQRARTTVRPSRSGYPAQHKPIPAADGERVSRGARVGGRILLVEDNPQVADVTAQMLTAMGFQVEVTDRARKAIERLDTDGIDLLLTDVVMPDGLNGVDLAARIRARHPALPILLTSGYNDVAVPDGAAFPMLRKPVPYDDLYRAICAGLASAGKTIVEA